MRMDGVGLRDRNRWDRIAGCEWMGWDCEMEMDVWWLAMEMNGVESRGGMGRGSGWDREVGMDGLGSRYGTEWVGIAGGDGMDCDRGMGRDGLESRDGMGWDRGMG